jgi:hypothetical protein
LATKYVTAVGTLKEEFANLANGGYAPTEAAWRLAERQVNENYGVKQLGSSLDEIQRLIRYRFHAMPNMDTLGPGAGNRYLGTTGQAIPQPNGETTSGPARVSTKGEYDRLASGTQYTAPDGTVRTKP